jgi:endogenous inhibitor of DNA gyrase (YacG/DUF329 family)
VSSRPVICPNCKTTVLVEQRQGRTKTLNRGVDRVAYLQVNDHQRAVVIICPDCGGPVRWKGKRILIVDAA